MSLTIKKHQFILRSFNCFAKMFILAVENLYSQMKQLVVYFLKQNIIRKVISLNLVTEIQLALIILIRGNNVKNINVINS